MFAFTVPLPSLLQSRLKRRLVGEDHAPFCLYPACLCLAVSVLPRRLHKGFPTVLAFAAGWRGEAFARALAADLPRFELDNTVTPTPVNPLGAKGVGEAGTLGSTPCVVSAAVAALSQFGVTHIDMMLRPEKLWQIIHGGQS